MTASCHNQTALQRLRALRGGFSLPDGQGAESSCSPGLWIWVRVRARRVSS